MGLLDRIADWIRPETRAREVSWDALRGGVDLDGGIVNPRVAENLSTVLSCVQAISSAMASLPAYVYSSFGTGRQLDEQHPVAKLIANGPNEHQSWPDWLEWTLASVLLRGNALSQIVSDARGTVIALKPIPYEWASIQLLSNGRLAYDVTEMTSISGGTGRPRRLLQDEIFHLRDRSDDGLIGRSRLQRAASVVSTSLSMQVFADSMYRNGVNPSGILEAPGTIPDEQLQRLRKSIEDAKAGAAKAGRIMVLTGGMTWKQVSINPDDAEFLASRRFSVEEICRMFNVPPPIAGDLTHGTFANTETLVRLFATNTLTPWCRKVEAEFTRSVFSAAHRSMMYRLELDLSGLLRGDPAQRWAAWEIAARNQILTVDEIRAEEGWDPRGKAAIQPAAA